VRNEDFTGGETAAGRATCFSSVESNSLDLYFRLKKITPPQTATNNMIGKERCTPKAALLTNSFPGEYEGLVAWYSGTVANDAS
jgi:hypothetical protein